MKNYGLLIVFFLSVTLLVANANAEIKEHTFHVKELEVERLCERRVITAVNGRMPGPVITVHEGDTLVVHVINHSPYNLTIHWHGVFQILSAWSDGPAYVTQCPIPPGRSYTYRFTLTGQEGTLWWHAHVSWLRATIHGALVIKPRDDVYPFPERPYKEVPIILGEWWDANVVDVEDAALASGGAPDVSDAFTINGRPGHLYLCSSSTMYELEVVRGETYLLRIINAALNNQIFFRIAGHRFTVVAVDASYTERYDTDVVVIAPGQTVDALLIADRSDEPPCDYYMAASPYQSASGLTFDNTTTTAVLRYHRPPHWPTLAEPLMPEMPEFNDTPTAHRFYSGLKGLLLKRFPKVPLRIDEKMFIAFGLGVVPCEGEGPCHGFRGQRLAASMNNVSFEFPSTTSLLEAHFRRIRGVYTTDFPDAPPMKFDYTNPALSFDASLYGTTKGTRMKRVRHGAVVEVVLQNTALLGVENHPIHLHGFNFFVLAQGFGNYPATADQLPHFFNLVNPQVRNTIAVPVGGWAVIRFRANNPGVWIMHCHLDVHLPWGLAMAFEVENGPDASSTLPPPPSDFPEC